MGYGYVNSQWWWILGIVLALALVAVVGGVWIVADLSCVDDWTGFQGGQNCSDSELAAHRRDFKNRLMVAFPLLTIFNVLNAWRLARQGNKKMQENTG